MTLMAHSIGTLALGSRHGSGWTYTASRGRGCLIYNAWSGPLLPRKGVGPRKTETFQACRNGYVYLKHFYRAMVKYQISERSHLLLSLENSAFATSYMCCLESSFNCGLHVPRHLGSEVTCADIGVFNQGSPGSYFP